jgi:hypothetical protein
LTEDIDFRFKKGAVEERLNGEELLKETVALNGGYDICEDITFCKSSRHVVLNPIAEIEGVTHRKGTVRF